MRRRRRNVFVEEDGSSGEIAMAVKAGMAFRPFLCDIIHDDPIPWVMITQNK